MNSSTNHNLAAAKAIENSFDTENQATTEMLRRTVPKVGTVALAETMRSNPAEGEMPEGVSPEPSHSRRGPAYEMGSFTEGQLMQRYQDWAAGIGRALDTAWYSGRLEGATLLRWIELKQKLAEGRATGDINSLMWFVVDMRVEVFEFTRSIGTGSEAIAAYDAAVH